MSSSSAASSPQPQSGYRMDFDPRYRVLRVCFFGVVTDAMLTKADCSVRLFLAGEGADFGIFDWSEATEVQVTTAYIRAIAELAVPLQPMKLRIAVAPRPDVYRLNQMYVYLIEGRRSDARVVRTMKEAEDLISLGPLDFSREL